MLIKETFEQIGARHKQEIAGAIALHNTRMEQLAHEQRLELAEWALSDKPADFVIAALDIIRAPLVHLMSCPGEPDAEYMVKLVDRLEAKLMGGKSDPL